MKKLERFTTTSLPRNFYSRPAFWEREQSAADKTRELFSQLGKARDKFWLAAGGDEKGCAILLRRVNALEAELGLSKTTLSGVILQSERNAEQEVTNE